MERVTQCWGCGFKETQPHQLQRDAGSNEPDLIYFNPEVARAANITIYYIHKSSSPGGPRELQSHQCPPGTEISVGGPRSSSSLRSKSWGGFWSVLSSYIWLWRSSSALASRPSGKAFSSGGAGVAMWEGSSISMLSSSSTMMSESCC